MQLSFRVFLQLSFVVFVAAYGEATYNANRSNFSLTFGANIAGNSQKRLVFNGEANSPAIWTTAPEIAHYTTIPFDAIIHWISFGTWTGGPLTKFDIVLNNTVTYTYTPYNATGANPPSYLDDMLLQTGNQAWTIPQGSRLAVNYKGGSGPGPGQTTLVLWMSCFSPSPTKVAVFPITWGGAMQSGRTTDYYVLNGGYYHAALTSNAAPGVDWRNRFPLPYNASLRAWSYQSPALTNGWHFRKNRTIKIWLNRTDRAWNDVYIDPVYSGGVFPSIKTGPYFPAEVNDSYGIIYPGPEGYPAVSAPPNWAGGAVATLWWQGEHTDSELRYLKCFNVIWGGWVGALSPNWLVVNGNSESPLGGAFFHTQRFQLALPFYKDIFCIIHRVAYSIESAAGTGEGAFIFENDALGTEFWRLETNQSQGVIEPRLWEVSLMTKFMSVKYVNPEQKGPIPGRTSILVMFACGNNVYKPY